MRRILAEEFQDRASEYLDARETLAIERDGTLIGHYVPVDGEAPARNGSALASRLRIEQPRPSEEEMRQLLDNLSRAVKRLLDETGMTEDELADLFDLNKPFPHD